MPSFVKSVTFDCHDPLTLAAFWAAALGSDVDEDSTTERAWVEPAGWGGPSLWFQQVPEAKVAKNRQHFDLRAMGPLADERDRLDADHPGFQRMPFEDLVTPTTAATAPGH